jgi:hypothetical protein
MQIGTFERNWTAFFFALLAAFASLPSDVAYARKSRPTCVEALRLPSFARGEPLTPAQAEKIYFFVQGKVENRESVDGVKFNFQIPVLNNFAERLNEAIDSLQSDFALMMTKKRISKILLPETLAIVEEHKLSHKKRLPLPLKEQLDLDVQIVALYLDLLKENMAAVLANDIPYVDLDQVSQNFVHLRSIYFLMMDRRLDYGAEDYDYNIVIKKILPALKSNKLLVDFSPLNRTADRPTIVIPFFTDNENWLSEWDMVKVRGSFVYYRGTTEDIFSPDGARSGPKSYADHDDSHTMGMVDQDRQAIAFAKRKWKMSVDDLCRFQTRLVQMMDEESEKLSDRSQKAFRHHAFEQTHEESDSILKLTFNILSPAYTEYDKPALENLRRRLARTFRAENLDWKDLRDFARR